jgi:hypothetical protein
MNMPCSNPSKTSMLPAENIKVREKDSAQTDQAMMRNGNGWEQGTSTSSSGKTASRVHNKPNFSRECMTSVHNMLSIESEDEGHEPKQSNSNDSDEDDE